MTIDPAPTIARVRILRAVGRSGGRIFGSGQSQVAQHMAAAGLLERTPTYKGYRLTDRGEEWLRDVERHWAGWAKTVAP